ncbi:MAG: hypothetical protein AAF725_14470 [Acidobacteriota bacterium]
MRGCRLPRGSRGYNLVVLTVSFTLLTIWVASVTPLWSHQIKRDKEAELIFRGLQYAEAIRRYQQQTGSLPTKLRDLIEVEPRCIRQLWTNPMTEDGRWGLIPEGVTPGAPGQGQNLAGGSGLPQGEGDAFPGDGRSAGDGTAAGPNGNQPAVILSEKLGGEREFGAPERPATFRIRGVYHPEGEESIRTFLSRSSHREWQFTTDLYSTMKQGTPDNPALVTPFLAEEIGKPWPPGVVPQVPQPSDKPQQPQPGQGAGQQAPIRNPTYRPPGQQQAPAPQEPGVSQPTPGSQNS